MFIARNRNRNGVHFAPTSGFTFTSQTSGYRTVRVRTPAASVETGPLTVSLAEGVGYTPGTVAELCVPIKARGEVSPRYACASRGRNAEPEPLSAELLDLPVSHGGDPEHGMGLRVTARWGRPVVTGVLFPGPVARLVHRQRGQLGDTDQRRPSPTTP